MALNVPNQVRGNTSLASICVNVGGKIKHAVRMPQDGISVYLWLSKIGTLIRYDKKSFCFHCGIDVDVNLMGCRAI